MTRPDPERREPRMEARLNHFAAAPALMKQISRLLQSGLSKAVWRRACSNWSKSARSQINGCANCLNMHTSDARKEGETEQRLHLLAAWHEAPVYSERERAALAWTEHLTACFADQRAPDDVYAALDAQFSKEEQIKLTVDDQCASTTGTGSPSASASMTRTLGWEGKQTEAGGEDRASLKPATQLIRPRRPRCRAGADRCPRP